MKYHVLIGDEEREVEVTLAPDGSLEVAIGDRTHHVDVGEVRDGASYHLCIDDRSIDVGVEEEGDGVALLIGGRRYTTDVLGEREYLARTIKGAGGEDSLTVPATMTGIVRDVLVAPGDAVAKGQTLLILEAMKMENEVKAGADATVARVRVETGATVSQGDVLIELE